MKAYKFRLYPSRKLGQKLLRTLEMCRLVYNWALEGLRGQEKLDLYALKRRLPKLKAGRPSSRDRARDTLRSFESGSWFGSCLPATHLSIRTCEKVVCMRLTEILGSALVGIGAFLLVWAFWEARSILALNLGPGEIFSTAIAMGIMFTTGGFMLIRGIKLVERSSERKRAEARR